MPVGSTPQGAKNKGEESFANTGRTGQEAKGKVAEVASSAAQQLKETASGVAHKASDLAAQAGQKVQDAASTAKGKADDALSGVGQKMTALADTIREQAPHEGMLGTAAASVADNLRAGGQYLQQHHMEDMMKDVTALMRNYPLQSVLVGFGVGFLVGTVFRSRR
jgi:ElaB/YqjD/DUF883 family membrane-anchored ribosome-binding protein